LRAGSIGWHDEHEDEERRRVRKAMSISIGIHVALFAALVISPPSSLQPLPATIAVELVAGPQIAPPAAPPAPRPRGRKTPPPPPAPEPPAPEAAPQPPPPPIAKAPVQVLPENAPKPDKKVKQAPEKKPKEVAKAEAKEKPAEKPAKEPAKKPEKDLSYEDAMKSLDEELGEDETEDLLARAPARPNVRTAAESSGAAQSQAGVKLSPEEAAWIVATRRLIQSKWVTPSNFSGRGLQTVMKLQLSASGAVIGEPEVVRTSGDPYFDDNAVKAVIMVSPLPVPPRPGTTTFVFSSEE
jgi:membrane protein involved in colicin uptake